MTSPVDSARSLLTPDRSRWKPMLAGLAVCALAVAAAGSFKPPKLVEAVLLSLAFAAWSVGAFAMVGYVRWFFASELSQAKRSSADPDDRDNK